MMTNPEDANLYDRKGGPITWRQFIALKYDNYSPDGDYLGETPNREYVVIGQDLINDVVVSTVWLGLDHSLGLPGHPRQIFETMTFSDRPKWDDQLLNRYATEAEAVIGHLLCCAIVRGEGREITR